ncbi:MAG: CHAT domain-containing protein [Minicystis sp.]
MLRGRALRRHHRLLHGRRRAAPGETVLTLAGKLLLPFVLSLTGSLSPRAGPEPALDVTFAGCDVVRTADGTAACKVTGASIFDGAARGPQREGDRRLTLWVSATPGAKVWAAVDGNPVKPFPQRSAEQLEIAVYRGARELTVTAELSGAAKVFHLPLTGEELPEQKRLDEAMALRREGSRESTARAAAMLTALAQSESPAVRAKAAGQLARMKVGSNVDEGIAGLREAMDLDRAAGLVSDEVADAYVLVANMIDGQRDLAAASRVLDRIDPLLRSFPVGRAMTPHYRAQIVAAWGALGTAARLLRTSELRAEELDLRGHLADVYQDQMDVLERLGRPREAAEAVRRLEALDAPRSVCAEAQRQANLGLYALRAERASAKSRLDRALALFSDPDPAVPGDRRCSRPVERSNVLALLTQLAIDTGAFDDARAYLDRAQAEAPDAIGHRAAQWSLLAGRADLAQGKPDRALARFEEAAILAQVWDVADIEVDANVGRAEALEALGRVEEADRAYAAADERLDRWSALIPLGDGKQSFFRRRDGVVRRYLDLLLRRAERPAADAARWAAQAGCVARRSRARLLAFAEHGYRMASSPERTALHAALDRYERERAPLDVEAKKIHRSHEGASRDVRLAELRTRGVEIATALDRAVSAINGDPPARTCAGGASRGLPDPAPGEAILVYHPVEDGWAGFAITAGGEVVAKRLHLEALDRAEPPSGAARDQWRAALADSLLVPFAAALADKRKIRVIAAEPLGAVDFHELPFAAQPLGARFSVSYGVDLLRRPDAVAAAPSGPRRALIVTPDADLPMTRVEADNVRRALEKAGFRVVLLAGSDATREAVRERLMDPGVEIFHYAGHGFAEGRDGWEGRLSLARGEWLGLADVMTLARVPRVVTLSSCEAASASREAHVEGLALAQAFLVAGAEVAVASTRKTDDAFTNKIMSELYAGHLDRFLTDPAAALHEATSAVRSYREMAGVVDLPPLRVLVR